MEQNLKVYIEMNFLRTVQHKEFEGGLITKSNSYSIVLMYQGTKLILMQIFI